MGITLKSPVIVGACNLTTDAENIKKIEASGAGAIVYKSLFEEQVQLEKLQFEEEMMEYNDRYSEVSRIFPDISHAGTKEYLHKLKKLKSSVSIPVFGSLNAITKDTWVEYALQLEETGIDGLELNLYETPGDFYKEAAEIEAEQLQIVRGVLAVVRIPVAVKLSPFYSNILGFVKKLDDMGVASVVLFNQLFQPDINTEDLSHFFPYNLSDSNSNRLPLRYTAHLHGNISADISAGTGIYSGNDIAKLLLAGADTVQVVSALYRNGIGTIEKMITELAEWMGSKGFNSIDDFKGKLSRNNMKDPFAYKRSQYVDILFNSREIFEKYPQV